MRRLALACAGIVALGLLVGLCAWPEVESVAEARCGVCGLERQQLLQEHALRDCVLPPRVRVRYRSSAFTETYRARGGPPHPHAWVERWPRPRPRAQVPEPLPACFQPGRDRQELGEVVARLTSARAARVLELAFAEEQDPALRQVYARTLLSEDDLVAELADLPDAHARRRLDLEIAARTGATPAERRVVEERGLGALWRARRAPARGR